MLSVKVTVEATFPDARLCYVIALADISLYRISFARIKVQYKSHKSENLFTVGLDREEHLRPARTVHSL